MERKKIWRGKVYSEKLIMLDKDYKGTHEVLIEVWVHVIDT